MLRHYAEEPLFFQRDGFNCGILSYMNCIQTYKNQFKFHELEGNKEWRTDLQCKMLKSEPRFV